MTIKTRVDPLGKDFMLTFLPEATPEGRSRILSSFAKEKLAEAQKINQAAIGHIPPHDTIVDGAIGAREESVRPDGTIAYSFHLISEAIAWIEEALLKASPHLSGRYKKSHILYADDVEYPFLADVPEGAKEFVLTNSVPYARKIERGQSKQAREGVFQVVATMAQRRFGNIASIKFTFEDVRKDSALESWASSTKQVRKISPKTTESWNRRQPAIRVRVL